MNARFERLVLLALALSAAFVGLWGLLAPASFYTGFPGAARRWVAVDGPFNEHLVRDVGALNCALCVLSMVALLHPERALVRATGLTWLIFAVPHLAYHADHLGLYNRMDQVLNLVSLGGVVVLATTLVLPKRKGDSAPATVPLPGMPVVDKATGATL
jgi:hypothetical protein